MPLLYRLILLNGWLLEHKFLLNNWFYMHSVLFEAYSPMIWRYLDHRLSDLSEKWNGCQPNADFTCVQFLLGFCHWNVICSIGDSLDFMMSGSPREVKAISYPYHRQCHNSSSAASRKTQMRHLYDMWHSRLSDSWICLDTPPVHIVRAHRFEYPIPYYAPAQRDYLDILSSPTSLDYVC